jgi:MFS family permease
VTEFALKRCASVWCGLSPNVTQLIIARALQGIGAALLIPCSLAIIGASFPETERGRGIGTWAGFSAIAAAMGPLLGGWIVDHIAWQAIFLINPFIALPAIWIALRHVPESYDPEAPPGIDWVGAMLAFGGSGQHRVRTGRSPRPQRARSVACCLLFCRRSAAAHGVRMARRSSSVTHDAPWPVSFAQLQRHQRDDVAALRRAQRRLLPSTV